MAATAQWRKQRFLYEDIPLVDFSGGLNLRDAVTELAPNESPGMLNVTLNERGGAEKRLGYTAWNATLADEPITYGYDSDVCNLILWYSEENGQLYRDTDGTLLASRTFTASGRISIVDFAGKCYLIHSADGLYESTDGATWTLVTATSGFIPGGDQLAVWQNKLWVANSANNLLSFSAPGDATKWDSADDAGQNWLREGNDYPIVALYGSSGTDVQAQPALLVGKRSGTQGSLHRVTDAATGDYVTLDQAVGPAGPLAITSLYGRIYMISTAGIFSTDGQTPLMPVGQKIDPLFRADSLDYTRASRFCAGRQGSRVFFSLTTRGYAHNNLCLEYNPIFGSFTYRNDSAACYVSHGVSTNVLLGAHPSTAGKIVRMNTGGSDDGAPIKSWWLTRVFEPAAGYQARLQHIRLAGRSNEMKLSALANFAAEGPSKTLEIVQDGLRWDVDGWDDPNFGWGENIIEGYADFWPRLLGRSFQLRIDETSSFTMTTPPLLETGAAQTVGAWAVYGIHLSFSPLAPS